MTNKEAIERINEHIAIHRYNEPQAIRIAEALQMGIYALEKQIPKKPTIKQDRYNENLYTLYCPTCGSYIGMYNKRLKMSDFFNNSNRNICNRCGQAIDCEVEA